MRAARWLQSAGLTAEALDHWLLAGHPTDALRLLADEQDQLYCNGDEAVIRDAMARLAEVDATSGTWLDDRPVLVLRTHRPPDDSPISLEQVNWLAGETGATDVESLRAATIGAIAALVGGRWTEGAQIARDAVRKAPDSTAA